MLDISWGELVLIGMVALIVIGPKELPTVLRTVGQWMTKIRRMASEFQGQFQEAMREAEFADLKKQVDSIADPTKSFADYNPLETARKEFESALEDKKNPASPAVAADTLAAADAPPAPPPEAAGTGVDTTTSSSTSPPTVLATSAEPASNVTSSADVDQSSETSPAAPAEPVPAATQSDLGGGRAA